MAPRPLAAKAVSRGRFLRTASGLVFLAIFCATLSLSLVPVARDGYPGYLISVEKMKGCRAVQCLLKKTDDEVWKPEDDDQYFEIGGMRIVVSCLVSQMAADSPAKIHRSRTMGH